MTLTLGVTLGEPAGIGPEVTVGALSSPEVVNLDARFTLFGPRPIYALAAAALETAGRDPGVFRKLVEEQRVRFGEPVLEVHGNWGQPAPQDEMAVVESIRQACAAALSGQTAGMVTAPVDKRALFHQGYPGWGHTELLAHFTGAPTPTMVLMSRPNPKSKPLRVALVTNHVRLADVAPQVNAQAIVAKARVLAEGLRDLGIDSPRLAVAGLNPHAGEKGELGTEEIDVIQPAIATLKSDGIQLHGPISADTVFVRAIAGEFDAILALYHDQGIIPVKVYGFGHGVNWTLGLPIVRTSPDHGTAYDIAGTGRADPRSMIEAILLAAQLASRKRSGASDRSNR